MTETEETETETKIREVTMDDDRVWARGAPMVPEEDISVEFEAVHPDYPDQATVWNRVVIKASNWGRAKAAMRGGKTTTFEETLVDEHGKEFIRRYTVRDHHSSAAAIDRLFKTYVVSVNDATFSMATMHPDSYPPGWMTAFIGAFNRKAGTSIEASLAEARGKSETP